MLYYLLELDLDILRPVEGKGVEHIFQLPVAGLCESLFFFRHR